MATEETMETRLISGTGLIRIPTDNSKKRVYTLYGQVVRPPRSPYLNLKSNPPEGFFARITCVKNNTVFRVFDQTFDQQAWTFNPDVTSQTLIAIKCMYDGLLQTFVNLGNAQLLLPFIVDNTIEEYKHLSIEFDEFRVVCYATTAIAFTLKGIDLDICKGDYETPQPPSEPPTEPAKVSSTTPLDISSPYSNDDVSSKADIDESYTPPAIGGECQPLTLTVQFTYLAGGTTPTPGTKVLGVYGPVSPTLRVKNGIGGVIEGQFRGYTNFGGCQGYEWRDVESLGSLNPIQSIDNLTIT